MAGAGGGGVPKVYLYGWYKRRLPILTAPLLAGTSGGGATAGVPLPAVVVTAPRPGRRGYQVGGRVPLPGRIEPRPTPPVVVGVHRRGEEGRVFSARVPGKPPVTNVAGGVLPARIVRRDYQRGGLVYQVEPPRKPVVNVAGGVLPPWAVRRDYERGGRVYRVQPFLKAPPPPVAGGVPSALVRRWDFERAGLIYRERRLYRLLPPLLPPPVLFDIDTWTAGYRDNEWDSDNRGLSWRADVDQFLTKRTQEVRKYTMDFSALPELQSATLASVSSVTATALTVGASNVVLATPALGTDGKSATVWISGGVSGASYKIAFVVTIAGGTVLEDFGYLLVEDE